MPSRKSVKKAIKSGSLKVDGAPATTGLWIQPGMVITFEPEGVLKPQLELKIPVLYDDDHLAVVYKPAGLLTSGNKFRTLENTLPFNLSKSHHHSVLLYPRPVHRLDYGTSGLIIIAKTPEARIKLGEMLKEHKISKTYKAVVHGEVRNCEGEITFPIEEKPAISTYRSLQNSKSKRYSLLELSPKTGRTHQLRIHCSKKGFPIVGDKNYGPGYDPGKGLFLCATGLEFIHPTYNTKVLIEIESPNKFSRLLNI